MKYKVEIYGKEGHCISENCRTGMKEEIIEIGTTHLEKGDKIIIKSQMIS